MEVFKLFASFSLQDLISGPINKVTARLNKAAESSHLLSSRVAKLGKAMLPVIGAASAVALHFGICVKAAGEFETSLTRLAMVNREGKEALETLEKAALKMGASSVFSANEVVAAQAALAQAGFNAADNIAVLGRAEKYALVAGQDLASASAKLADILGGYGLGAESAAHVTDVMTAASRSADISLTELADTLHKSSTMFRSLGVPIEDAAGVLAVFAEAGIKGQEAGSILEHTIYKLTSPTGDAAEAFKRLGISTELAGGKLKSPIATLEELASSIGGLSDAGKVDVLKKIFGDKADKLIYPLLDIINKEGVSAISKFSKELGMAAGITEKLAEIQNATLGSSFKRLGNSINSINITIGKLFAPTVAAIANKLAAFAGWLQEIAASPIGAWVLKLVAGLAIGVLALGAIAGAVAAASVVIPALLAGIAAIGAAASALALPLLVVTAVIVAFYILWKKNVGGIADIIKDKFAKINLIIKGVAAVFTSLKNGVGEIRGALAEDIQANGLVGAVTTIGKIFYRVYMFAKGFFAEVGEGFSEVGQSLAPVIDLFKKILVPVGDFVKVQGWVISKLTGATAAINSSAWESFGKIIGFLVTGPFRALALIIGTVAKLLLGLYNIGEAIGSGIATAISWIIDKITELKEFFNSLNLFDSGKKLIGTFTEGITSTITAPFEAVKGGLSKLRNLLPFSDAREGPLSELTLSGSRMMTTLGQGVTAGAPNLYKASFDAFKGIPELDMTSSVTPLMGELPPLPTQSLELTPAMGEAVRTKGANNGRGDKQTTINISNITLPNVTSGSDLIRELELIMAGG